MREFISMCASKVKGRKIVINENIPYSYIVSTIIDFAFGFIRGAFTFRLASKGKMFIRANNVKLRCKSKINLASNIRIGERVLVDALSIQGVNIGNNATIGSHTIIKCTGSFTDIGVGLKIGNNFGCGDNCFFGAAGGISIGNDVIMGQSVRFHAQNHCFSETSKLIREQGTTQKGIKIGNDCWIGSGVVFLDGVRVGSGCVIGANTLVNQDIPSNSIAVGNPVRIIKKR